MSWFQALIAGIVQGLTEFIPVSSSGHLIIVYELFGEGDEPNLAFSVFLHLATLLSLIIVFHKDIWMLIREFFSALVDLLKGKPDFTTPNRRFLLMVIIGTIPAMLTGVTLSLLGVTDLLENIFIVAPLLLVTSALMFSVDRIKDGERTEADAPVLKTSLIVGIMQAFAIFPGLSRSGSTIFGGLLGGLSKEFAVRYAFILSIPVILGAGLMEALGIISTDNIDINIVNWLTGFVAATVCGIIAIKLIKILIKSKKFYIFGIYCLLASITAFLAGTGIIS